MERSEKIRLLKGIAEGTRELKELAIIHDPILLDEDDNSYWAKAAKANGVNIIYARDFEKLKEKKLIKGFVIDMRGGSYKFLSFD